MQLRFLFYFTDRKGKDEMTQGIDGHISLLKSLSNLTKALYFGPCTSLEAIPLPVSTCLVTGLSCQGCLYSK